MPELEAALVELGRSIEFPPTPDLASRVRERIAAERGTRRRPAGFLTARRTLVVALAVAAVAVGALMAVPGTRAAILEFFGVRGVTIERVDTLPTVPKSADLELGERVSVEEARELAEFDVVVPEALGDPDEVYFSEFPPGGMVSFVYGSSEEPRALLTQFKATVRDAFFKKVEAGTQVESVMVDGQPGIYLSGEPHVFGYLDENGAYQEETLRLVGNVLLWERPPLTLRLEGDLSKELALRIARSVD